MSLKGTIDVFSEEDWVLWRDAQPWINSSSELRNPFKLQLENGLVLVAANGMKAWFDFGEVVETEESYVRSQPIDNRAHGMRLVDYMFRIQDEINYEHLVKCGFELE